MIATGTAFARAFVEQDMISDAGRLSAIGLLSLVSTSGKFAMRGYDRLKMDHIGHFNLKIVPS
jgi:transketolase C-terminal domain/subunit